MTYYQGFSAVELRILKRYFVALTGVAWGMYDKVNNDTRKRVIDAMTLDLNEYYNERKAAESDEQK